MIETTIYDSLAEFTNAAITNDEHTDVNNIHVLKFGEQEVDVIRMALEKQMPRVPDTEDGHPVCNRCGKMLFSGDVHCSCCGQRRAKE